MPLAARDLKSAFPDPGFADRMADNLQKKA
jgi:hypothetical protein